jgi:uncharacterized glyoxalase superfamily protein PhnB
MTNAETNAERSITSEVEVPVDPDTAFVAFTEELDLWWVRGPINHWAGGRVVSMRCDPGVGGRLLEVYDNITGDALELAVITASEPGRRLAWHSSVDDVETEVLFEPVGAGTCVRVIARIPAGGQDRGGTSWTRVVPTWFGAWCRRRNTAPRQVQDLARMGLAIYYAKPAAAARWLAQTFGFSSPDPLPEGADPLPEGEHGHPWMEFRLGNCSLVIFKLEEDGNGRALTHVPWVYVDDIDAHFTTAEAHGATIIQKLHAPWGLPFYVADDPEGNRWMFAQARPTMR